MNIVEMRDKRAKLWATMEGFLDTHRSEKGVLSVDDDITYNNMEKELNDLTNEIKRTERRDAIEAELKKPVGVPITEKPMKSGTDEKRGRASDAYKEDFGLNLRGKKMLHNVLSEGVDANGGYLVPEEFERQIVDALREENVMRQLCKIITTANERKIPIAGTHSVAAWTAENAAYTESNPTFDQKTIDAYKLTDLIKVSIELLDDSAFPLEPYIAQEFANAFGVAEETAFCVGSGSGQPPASLPANGRYLVVSRAAGATAVTADEFISLIYALESPLPARMPSSFYERCTVAALRKLKDGNGQYLWQPSVQAGQPDKLLGYDIFTSPYVPVMAAGAYAIAYGDFQNYWIADRTGRTVQRLNELYSTNGQVGFVATERVDGKIIMPEGIQLLKMHG